MMLLNFTASLVATTFLLTTAIAAPIRTHCRCTIVSESIPIPSFAPSVAYRTPVEALADPLAGDVCSDLGPELEDSKHTRPDLYELYLGRTERSSGNNGQQQPFTTTKISMTLAARSGLRREINDKETRQATRPHPRIMCHAETDPVMEYQGSFVTLCVIQIIVIIAIIACIAEGVHLSLSWYISSSAICGHWKSGYLRVPGAEKLVLDISSLSTHEAEKYGQTHGAAPILIVEAPDGNRLGISYEEDDDDEMNRPVM